MKLSISLDDNLVNRIDSYADSIYTSRSGFITLACSQYLNQAEVLLMIKEMSFALKKISDNGVVDDNTLRQLEDFDRICKMLVGNM